MANLLVNAVKYSPENSEVTFSVGVEGEQALITVSDLGAGMSASLLKRIFDPFVQGASTIDFSRGGMGVGLTLVKTIIKLHSGTIKASSPGEGLGSTFTCEIPISKLPIQSTQEKQSEAAKSDSSISIVVVEDEDDIRDMMTLLLEMEGHRVIAVSDGLSAVTAIEVEKPELAFIDIGLPELDGYEVMSQLQRLGCDKRTYCVALTGFGQQKDLQRSIDAGFRKHITKPVNSEDLESSIHAAIRLREKGQLPQT